MPETTNNDTKNFILTEEEVHIIRDNIESIKLSIFKTDFNLEKHLDKHFTPEQKEFLLMNMNLKASPSEIEQSVDSILSNIKNKEILTVKTSFEPTVSFIDWIKGFLLSHVKDSVVVKLSVDKSLIAGVVLEYKGRIKNLSLKSDILSSFTND